MSIGTNIKKLRRERDITQEQLAELLRLTPSAVSQWETDRVLPDISYLPALANIFRVSADVILGIDIEAREAQIGEIYNKVRDLSCTGHRAEANQLCRDGLSKFPDAYILMEELAFNLSYSSDRDDQEESISLFERILACSTDESSRNFAAGNLCGLYMAVGKTEAAKQLAETVPSPIYTREQCRLMTLRGADWADEMRSQTAIRFDGFIWDLRNLLTAFLDHHPLFSEHELLLLWQKVTDFVSVFHETGDFGFDEQLLMEARYHRALLYIGLNQPESALDELEGMLAHIEHFDRYSDGLLGDEVILPPDKWPTSLLIRPSDENDARLTMTNSSPSTENAAMDYLRRLSDPHFDSVRSHPRFCQTENRLRETARE